MKAKIRHILTLQGRGFRVLVKQNGQVEIWRKGKPEETWVYLNLLQALRDTRPTRRKAA